jgi:DNA-3-methyladenine glycosylase
MFNVVSNLRDTPHAILIRAVEPLKGTEVMLKRVGKTRADNTLTRGPGNVAKALGILTLHNGYSLRSKELFIADDGFVFPKDAIHTSARIGVDYAGKDALLPYRFYVQGSPYISGKPK